MKFDDLTDSRNRIDSILTAQVSDIRSRLLIADLPKSLSLSFSNFYISESTSEARKYGNRIYEISNSSELLILSTAANPASA